MKYFGLALILLFTSCSSKQKEKAPSDYSKSFRVPYETLWRATQQAMLNYPMNINNMDTGQLQTLFITGKHRYKPPHQKRSTFPSGYQYQINIQIIKGEKSSKLIVAKNVRLQKDFFSNPKELVSDGYEEKMILYRIKRELIIESVLKKQIEKTKQK